jgi:arylsulfatase A-like enzyme
MSSPAIRVGQALTYGCLCLLLANSRSAAAHASPPPPGVRPNVVLIMTDDQGWGDFAFHGNTKIHTPRLDALARQSLELTRFYVSPVCSPTRASLLTGRYNYRTGAIDTYRGRSSLAPDETTLAEMLSAAGYTTGIFGKWHLGDNYPSRAIDQGFREALVHRGGGVGQPSDPPGNRYFDPTLSHNGRDVKTQGYCSDVYTDAAIRFIEQHRAQPFFVYLAFNCPHTPLQVPRDYESRYQGQGLDADTAKIYGMVTNVDDNVGRLLDRLHQLQLDPSTIVVFLTDNGPQQPRYNGVLRDTKGSVYEGGIRAPCLLRWPGRFAAGKQLEQVSAHIDLAPTLLAACGVDVPPGVKFDGVSLVPLLLGQVASLPERLLFFQWHRGDAPQAFRNCAVRGPRFKWLQAQGRGEQNHVEPAWELYDLATDPGEQQNVIAQHPKAAAEMKAAYEQWLADVSGTRGFPPPQIIAGTKHENPVTLTRQDWRGPASGWDAAGRGNWTVEIATAGIFDVTVRLPAQSAEATIRLSIGELQRTEKLLPGSDSVVFADLALPLGETRVEAMVEQGAKRFGAHYVDLLWRPAAKTKQ